MSVTHPSTESSLQKRPNDVTAEASSSKRLCTPKSRPNLVGPQPIVTVKVRSDETRRFQTFQVHKSYICYYSPYFRAAFDGSFKEGESQELIMEETFPSIFGIFVNWLYTQKIVDKADEPLRFGWLIELWILADRVIAPRLQNDALDCLEQLRKTRGLPSKYLNKIYESTTEASSLRQWVVAVSVTRCSPLKDPDVFPRELLVDIINGFIDASRAAAEANGIQSLWKLAEQEEFYVDENIESARHALLAAVSEDMEEPTSDSDSPAPVSADENSQAGPELGKADSFPNNDVPPPRYPTRRCRIKAKA